MTPASVHVLVVDNPDDTELIRRVLRHAGCWAICERVDTPELLTTALGESSGWDVVLCDSVRPHLDVLRALALIRRIKPDLPVLVVSRRREPELSDALSDGELSGFLSKDRLVDLPALLHGLLAMSHGGRAREKTPARCVGSL